MEYEDHLKLEEANELIRQGEAFHVGNLYSRASARCATTKKTWPSFSPMPSATW